MSENPAGRRAPRSRRELREALAAQQAQQTPPTPAGAAPTPGWEASQPRMAPGQPQHIPGGGQPPRSEGFTAPVRPSANLARPASTPAPPPAQPPVQPAAPGPGQMPSGPGGQRPRSRREMRVTGDLPPVTGDVRQATPGAGPASPPPARAPQVARQAPAVRPNAQQQARPSVAPSVPPPAVQSGGVPAWTPTAPAAQQPAAVQPASASLPDLNTSQVRPRPVVRPPAQAGSTRSVSPTGELMAPQMTESGNLATTPTGADSTMVQPRIGETRNRLARQAAPPEEPRALDLSAANAAKARPAWDEIGPAVVDKEEIPEGELGEVKEMPIKRSWWVVILRYLVFIIVALVLGGLVWKLASGDGDLSSRGQTNIGDPRSVTTMSVSPAMHDVAHVVV